MRRARNSRFGLTVDEVMEQLEPLLERIRVPAREINREDMLRAYALIRELPTASTASTRALRRLYEAERDSVNEWRRLNPPPPRSQRIDSVAELLVRNATGKGDTVYDTVNTYGPGIGNNPVTFNRMTSGRSATVMLQYQRKRPSARDMVPTGDFIPSRGPSTSSTGALDEYSLDFGQRMGLYNLSRRRRR